MNAGRASSAAIGPAICSRSSTPPKPPPRRKEKSAVPERQKQMWKVTIAAPIETVWATLVKTDEVLPFLFGAVCDAGEGLAPGKPMRMVSADGKFVIAYGEVLEFTPPTRFSDAINFA